MLAQSGFDWAAAVSPGEAIELLGRDADFGTMLVTLGGLATYPEALVEAVRSRRARLPIVAIMDQDSLDLVAHFSSLTRSISYVSPSSRRNFWRCLTASIGKNG